MLFSFYPNCNIIVARSLQCKLSLSIADGVSVETDIGDGPTYTSTLSFSNLDVSHSGEFICRSQIMTPAIPGMINKTAEWELIVIGTCMKSIRLSLSI